MPTDIQYLQGGGEDLLFIDSAQTNKSFKILYVADDAVLTTLTDDNGVDLLVAYGLTGKTIPKGVLLFGKMGAKIKNITPSSGKLIGYR